MCAARVQPLPPPPFAGSVVTVSCPDQATADLIERHSRGWQNRQQARVAVVRRSVGKTPPADVVVLPAAELAHLVLADELEPIPDRITTGDPAYAWTGLLPLYREKLLVWQGKVYALPLSGDAPVCCYRKDWLGDPVHQAGYESKNPNQRLQAPATWADWERIAAYFANAKGQARPSLPPLPADDAELEREFYAIAAAYATRAVGEDEKVTTRESDAVFSFYYDLHTSKPRIDSPGFVHALQLLKSLQPYRGAGEAPLAAFRKGEAVLCLAQAWQLPALQAPTSAVRDRFGICRVPGSEGYFETTGALQQTRAPNVVPYLGSSTWLAGLARGSAQRQAALALLADLGGRQTSSQIVLDVEPGSRWAGGAVRVDQLEDRVRWDAFDLDQERTAALKDTLRQTLLHRGMKNPVLCLRVGDEQERQKLLVRSLRTALQPGGDPQKALRSAAEQWAQLDQKKGLANAMREYRISLGLLAR